MENNNPSEMTNEDLENDMQQKNQQTTGNQEHVKASTATEGKLLDPSEDPASIQNLTKGKETKLDTSGNIVSEDSQDGSGPDPEEMKVWEANDSGDKMSS